MIDFSTLQGLSIPEGVVTQITDESGRVLWVLNTGGNTGSGKIVLEVEKITADTYAGETTYTAEEFLVLDIYPKTKSSTVYVTYGDLTKTLTFSGTNAQQVYFGTLYGVADEVETPASGELTIEGDCEIFNVGTYTYYNTATSKGSTAYCGCIARVVEWNEWHMLTDIPGNMFYNCRNLTLDKLPSNIITIGENAFYYCSKITLTELPKGITSISSRAFYECDGITSMSIHEGVTTIGQSAFGYCSGMKNVSIPSSVTSIGSDAFLNCHNLENITVLATTPPTLGGDYVLDGTNACPIAVPAGCSEAYKSAEKWSEYADRIVEVS